MKKVIALVLAVLTLSLTLVSCAKKYECDLCGETKIGKPTKEDVFGEEVSYCKECEDEFDAYVKSVRKRLEFTCDTCREVKIGEKFEVEIWGQESTICKECKEIFDSLSDDLGDL